MKKILIICALLSLSFNAFGASRVFYDGFEDGTTTKWGQDDYRNRCTVVAASIDNVTGPFAGSKMAKCHDNASATTPWNDPAAFETLVINAAAAPYTSELFIRLRVRRDSNHLVTSGSPKKCCRVYVPNSGVGTPSYTDMFEAFYYYQGSVSQVMVGGTQWPTYWGGAAGDQLGNPSGWHVFEMYVGPGRVTVWHDKVKVEDFAAVTSASKFLPFYLTSNWGDAHNAGDIYFDEVEVFSDQGTGTTGLMSDATVQVAAVAPPPVNPLQAQLDAANATIVSLNATLTTANATIAAANASITALNAKIAKAQADLK